MRSIASASESDGTYLALPPPIVLLRRQEPSFLRHSRASGNPAVPLRNDGMRHYPGDSGDPSWGPVSFLLD